MSKQRKEYAYVASRIDPTTTKNLGDFHIRRKLPTNEWGEDWSETYHYASENYAGSHGVSRRGRVVNRRSLIHITRGSRIHNECIKAVERLLEEENL
ncbi:MULTISPECIES: hypothetical protein [Corynebacterium]|nr:MULTISPECIES: hypothetical protein [Corynebacterium]QJS16594.1 hypothetical protein HK412_10100 [Corynebacterium glutamicum]QXU45120.1 hypothetical protein KW808_12065 [[Brevibacterium] flavum]